MRHHLDSHAAVGISTRRLLRLNEWAALTAIACVTLRGTSECHAQVLYQDNFQSATNGQTILDAPVGWTGDPIAAPSYGSGAFSLVNTTPFAPALATTRTGVGASSNGGVAYFPISGISTTPGSGNILFTAQMFVPTVAQNGSHVGLSKSALGPFNNSGAYFAAEAGGVLRFDLRGLDTSTVHAFTAAESLPFLNKIITTTIDLNVNTNTVTGTITNGANTLTYTQTGGLDFSGFDRVVIDATTNSSPLALINVGSIRAAQTVLPVIPGDINMDSQVNLTDYGLLTSHWNQIVQVGTNGDLALHGTVNLADFKLFKAYYQNFNGGSGAELVPPVPEPTTFVLAAMVLPALVLACLWRRRFK